METSDLRMALQSRADSLPAYIPDVQALVHTAERQRRGRRRLAVVAGAIALVGFGLGVTALLATARSSNDIASIKPGTSPRHSPAGGALHSWKVSAPAVRSQYTKPYSGGQGTNLIYRLSLAGPLSTSNGQSIPHTTFTEICDTVASHASGRLPQTCTVVIQSSDGVTNSASGITYDGPFGTFNMVGGLGQIQVANAGPTVEGTPSDFSLVVSLSPAFN